MRTTPKPNFPDTAIRSLWFLLVFAAAAMPTVLWVIDRQQQDDQTQRMAEDGPALVQVADFRGFDPLQPAVENNPDPTAEPAPTAAQPNIAPVKPPILTAPPAVDESAPIKPVPNFAEEPVAAPSTEPVPTVVAPIEVADSGKLTAGNARGNTVAQDLGLTGTDGKIGIDKVSDGVLRGWPIGQNITAATTLESLAVRPVPGFSELKITDTQDTTFTVELDGAKTIGDVIDRIGKAADEAGSGVIARINEPATGLNLIDQRAAVILAGSTISTTDLLIAAGIAAGIIIGLDDDDENNPISPLVP